MKEVKEVKEKYLKEIYLNVLKAIIIIVYFFALNQAYANISIEHMEIGIKILTMIFLFIAIIIFEVAYKKDDDNLAIQGIEILVLSAYTITSKHITNKFNFDFRKYSLVASYIFAIYFVLKCIVIYTKGRKEEVENLSDIREIVKKEKPKKKEATKKVEKDNKKETTTKKASSGKTANKTTTSRKPSKKTTTTTKKSGEKKTTTTTKKTAEKTTTAKKTATKRTTTKKTIGSEATATKEKATTKKKIEKTKDVDREQKNEKPKRKSVKKEVKEND